MFALSCTAAQGQVTAEVLDGLCAGGMIIAGQPGLEPLCADINLVEKIIEDWNKPKPGAALNPPMTHADLYALAKMSGAKPIKVSK